MSARALTRTICLLALALGLLFGTQALALEITTQAPPTPAWAGILLGGLLALGWTGLAVALFSRNRAFFILAALSLTLAVLEATRRGYGGLYLWPDAAAWWLRSSSVLGHLALILFTLFLLDVARQEAVRLPLRRTLIASTALQGVLGLAALGSPVHQADVVALYATPLHGLIILAIALLVLRQQNTTSRHILVAVAAYTFVLLLLGALDRNNLLPESSCRLGLCPIDTGPLPTLLSFYIGLALLAAWISHITKQRRAAADKLMQWQQEENQRLATEVSRQTRALNQAVQYADEKNRQKTELLSYISHDLRTPMSTIMGYAKLLRQQADAAALAHIDTIERSARYQLSLIDELLAYTHSELRPLQLDPQPTNTLTLLDDIAAHAALLSTLQNNCFEAEAGAALPATVLLDARRLQQVLLNLLANAAKFTHNGEIRLRVDARPEHSATDPLPEQSALWRLGFTVSDSGVGIAHEIQPQIFHAYEQAGPQTDGAGLGLFIAQNLIRSMGGELVLQSQLHKGSTFSFEIVVPAQDATLLAWSPKPAPQQAMAFAVPDVGTVGARGTTSTVAPATALGEAQALLPAHERMELAVLAHDGRLTDIEVWLSRVAYDYPQASALFTEVRHALRVLDMERIENLALAQAGLHARQPQ